MNGGHAGRKLPVSYLSPARCAPTRRRTYESLGHYRAAIPELLAGTAPLPDRTRPPLCNWKAATAAIPGLNTNRELLERESAISIGVLPAPRSAATASLSDSAPAGDTLYEETVPLPVFVVKASRRSRVTTIQ